MKTALVCVAGLAAARAAGERYGIVTVAPPGLVPRRAAVPLARRDGNCRQGSHNCLDVGHGDQCCDNDSYCYVNRQLEPRCCPVGSNCVDDSPCKSDSFFCRQPAAADARSPRDGCCGRLCPQTSHYLCPQSLGGRCCPFGAACQSGGHCLQTRTSSWPAPSRTSALVGCAASQYRCADGTGCCGSGQRCMRVRETAYCAVESPADRGLSSGAVAGIGVGVASAVSIVVGAAAWLCVSGRRRRRAAAEDRSKAAMQRMSKSRSTLSPRSRLGCGLADKYHGPSPAPGPYTETAVPSATRLLQGLPRAVPPRPDGPGDIAAPVEMDSPSVMRGGGGGDDSGPSAASPLATRPAETTEGRCELYGCEAYHIPQPSSSPSLDIPPTYEA